MTMFTIRFGVEMNGEISEAIAREKRIKRWKRKWKLDLIEKENPSWEDLYDENDVV